jgi:hypothetical protein
MIKGTGSDTAASARESRPRPMSIASGLWLVIQHGGLPGLEYRFPVAGQAGETSRHTILFDGDTEYTLDCQSTPDQHAEIERACDTALNTLHRR